jgi:hypothetical protein
MKSLVFYCVFQDSSTDAIVLHPLYQTLVHSLYNPSFDIMANLRQAYNRQALDDRITSS